MLEGGRSPSCEALAFCHRGFSRKVLKHAEHLKQDDYDNDGY